MIIVDAPSPNFNERKDGKRAKYLILHYTGTVTAFEALRLLQGGDPEHQVSSHYFVDLDGATTRLVDENMRAWHAGKSYWEGEEDINSASIGIEIQNPGHDYGYTPFPDMQMKAVLELCQGIIARHGILPQHVLAHSDIAPTRKLDPGEFFPWASLAAHGVGLWPEIRDEDGSGDIYAILTKFGYDPRVEPKAMITAFQRHFEPEIFATSDQVGIVNPNTVKLAEALLRQKMALRPRA